MTFNSCFNLLLLCFFFVYLGSMDEVVCQFRGCSYAATEKIDSKPTFCLTHYETILEIWNLSLDPGKPEPPAEPNPVLPLLLPLAGPHKSVITYQGHQYTRNCSRETKAGTTEYYYCSSRRKAEDGREVCFEVNFFTHIFRLLLVVLV